MRTIVSCMGLITWAILLSLSISLSGCASREEKKPTTQQRMEKWQALADKSVSITPVPAVNTHKDESVLEDMVDPMETDRHEPGKKETVSDNRKLPTIPVTMQMHDISLPVLIRTLARVASLNIMINDSVKGQTKIAITNVPWNQAFVGILDTFGLTYEWSGNILRVVSVSDLKKKQALLEARQNYEKTKNKHDLTLMQLAQKKNRLEPLVTKIVKIHYADLHSLQKNLNQYLSSKPKKEPAAQTVKTLTATEPVEQEEADFQGNIMVDEFSNSLILHTSRANIKKIMPIIRQLDQPIKQVLIEAHIVEADSNTGKALGIQWGGLGTAVTDNGKSISIGGNMTEFGTPLLDAEGNQSAPVDGNIVNLPIAATTGMTLGVMTQKIGEFVLYTQLLALEEQGMLNILSKPSITTLNHRKAIIKSGKEVPFQTIENQEVSIEWKEAVIKLEVTPHIIDDEIIMLEILTHKDELDFKNVVNGNPTIITKNAETTVTLFDGQTTVIGGLSKEKSSDTEDGVPGLKNISGLGWLFKSVDKKKEMEELLIFITPHILKAQTFKPRVQQQ